jgi:hypothetical protein
MKSGKAAELVKASFASLVLNFAFFAVNVNAIDYQSCGVDMAT